MKTICIVGLGIGSLYVKVADRLGYNIITVDPNTDLEADYTDISELPTDLRFDMAIVCTPNYLHETIAKALVTHTDRIVIEKPGFESLERWQEFQKQHRTKIFMVKNNMYRTVFYDTVWDARDYSDIKNIKITWVNQDRVPGAGSWFTNKELAYGGVSRDLMPHALSVAQAILRKPSINTEYVAYHEQAYSLKDIVTTKWGKGNPNGVYNVDDRAYFSATVDGINIECATAWKYSDIQKDHVEWQVELKSGVKISYTAGLCPEDAYVDMLDAYMLMTDKKYQDYVEYDYVIHDIIDNFKTNPCKNLIDKLIHED